MKVIRSFHPVGQGAFYSERFYEDEGSEARYNIVYDCGTSWGSIIKAKKVVSQAFDKKDVIDYLFISHLDYDHISLVLTLIDSVKCVRKIVLPLVHKDEIEVGIALNVLSNHNDAADFLQLVADFVNGVISNDRRRLDSEIVFVGSEEERSLPNTQLWVNGCRRLLDSGLDWVFIPYNLKQQDRKEELISELDQLLHNAKLIMKVEDYKEALPSSGAGLFDKLKNPDFVKKVIATKELKNAIKSAYEKVTGGVNANSLLLYSGPSSTRSGYRMVESCYRWRDHYITRRCACLYTGDSNCDLPEWKAQFGMIWDNIGTIQLPHHGSSQSFDTDNNPIDRGYVFPVSCGNNNNYGHPSGKVLAYLLKNGSLPIIVTESSNTVFFQIISYYN